MTSTEEEVEDLLEDLTEYDDIETMLDELDEDVGLDSLDDDGEVFAEE
jgi:acyl carrier protein